MKLKVEHNEMAVVCRYPIKDPDLSYHKLAASFILWGRPRQKENSPHLQRTRRVSLFGYRHDSKDGPHLNSLGITSLFTLPGGIG